MLSADRVVEDVGTSGSDRVWPETVTGSMTVGWMLGNEGMWLGHERFWGAKIVSNGSLSQGSDSKLKGGASNIAKES